MKQRLTHIALVVADYDEAISFYCQKLGFDLIADEAQPKEDKRWVLVRPPGGDGCSILLAKARVGQEHAVGDQCAGRVFLFLETDDFDRDFQRYVSAGVNFIREPKTEAYGTVAVFEDLYGNLWDLVEFTK
ncbi:VOC family protein [Ahrensia sp. R2A130]|uniref:VOC family protein n=1 Tax=Ahrensia sp. R2A130 TaxID=744979 RepID=UPI0001E0E060|nr:VOC family protein [Ahrensia sp. R2A130]EFL90363.1 glyoxalase/bleomycin resistance protein/dioxygenase [Ahrensia sp. R2A130]